MHLYIIFLLLPTRDNFADWVLLKGFLFLLAPEAVLSPETVTANFHHFYKAIAIIMATLGSKEEYLQEV
jgi:hypothetical protein